MDWAKTTAWNGHVIIDGMTTVTLQTKYDPTLPSGYPKIAYPVEMSSGSGIYSDAVSHLPAAQPPTAKRPDDHVDVVYRDVIAGSRESRGHHYDAPFIYRILKSLLPQNNTFFIATTSVVKDALDTNDCERLREQWYYLRFYVRRTMPPTEFHSWMQHFGRRCTRGTCGVPGPLGTSGILPLGKNMFSGATKLWNWRSPP